MYIDTTRAELGPSIMLSSLQRENVYKILDYNVLVLCIVESSCSTEWMYVFYMCQPTPLNRKEPFHPMYAIGNEGFYN